MMTSTAADFLHQTLATTDAAPVTTDAVRVPLVHQGSSIVHGGVVGLANLYSPHNE